MELKFGPRHGNHQNWQRALVVKDNHGNVQESVLLVMVTTRNSDQVEIRTGKIYASQDGPLLWEGQLPADSPPTRAFAVAAGLCDSDGESRDLLRPAWMNLADAR